MNTVEKIKAICKERKIPISKLEKACGFANGYIGQLKKGSVPDDRLLKIASYLCVPVEYIASGTISTIDAEIAELVNSIIDNTTLRLIVEGARTLHDNEQEYVLNLIQLLNSKH